MKIKIRCIFRSIVSFVIALTALAYLVSTPFFLTSAGNFLNYQDNPEKGADALVVLMGSVLIRPPVAAQAVLAGYAPQVFMVESELNAWEASGYMPRESVIATEILRKSGLEPHKIVVITNHGRISSTAEEARALRNYFAARQTMPKRVIIVTSWFHARRSQWIFKKYFHGLETKIEMLPVDRVPFAVDDWWKSEDGLLTVFEEYIKGARYLVLFAGRNLES